MYPYGSIVLDKSDINSPLHPYLFDTILETFDCDPEDTQIELTRWHDDENVPFFVLNQDDIHSEIHPDMWKDFLEMLHLNEDTTELFLKKSV